MDNARNPPVRRLQWKKDFATRRRTLYKHLDNHLKAAPGCSIIDEFLSCAASDLEPPRRHEALRNFLDRTGARSFPEALTTCLADKRLLAMVDDRCDPSIYWEETGELPLRPWESDEYRRLPPSGLNARVYGANAEMLYNCLQGNRKGVTERRIVYIADLTPLMALALISSVAYLHLPQTRLYLSRHVEFQTYMGISQARGFILEFHVPHYVLRPDRRECHDTRGLRKRRYFRPPGQDEQDCIYEAQLSLIVSGVDDFVWTAYFCGDTYFSGGNSAKGYLNEELDGPSGGLRECSQPIWDPRYYFISALSARIDKVTMEWTVLVRFLEDYLDPHSEINPESLPKFLEDDPALDRTKEFTWTLCILRRLRNSITKLTTTWDAFEANHGVYFDLDADGALPDRFREYFNRIRQDVAELSGLHMVLDQRIETLEKMASVLVNASALAESMTATRQGDHIKLLTYITILYLPMTLVTGAFSMSQVTADVAWWKYWVAMICLTSITVGVASGLQAFAPVWRKISQPKTYTELSRRYRFAGWTRREDKGCK